MDSSKEMTQSYLFNDYVKIQNLSWLKNPMDLIDLLEPKTWGMFMLIFWLAEKKKQRNFIH